MRHLFLNICVSGFTQNRGYYHGILALREKLIADGHNAGLHRRVWYAPWTADWDRMAAELTIVANQHGLQPVVNISGYSYGGYGALKLAKALEPKGVRVRSVTLCDPVGRRWWWPRPLPAATSMLSRDFAFVLKVPANVQKLNEFYQTENRPQGHQLGCYRNATEQGVFMKLGYRHQRMDDAPEFHQCVLDEARATLSEYEAG